MGLFTNRYIEQLWVPQYPPIVCNLYMEDFEVKALSTAPHSPDWWFRYVDDTHIKIKKEFVGEFTNLINSLDQNIKFTSEEEEDSSLAFLDTLTIRYPDGQIKTRVYRKDTHTDQYLNFRWNHPLQHKLGVIRTLHHRAENVITDPEGQHREKDHINEALKDCDYPSWAIERASKPSDQRTKDDHKHEGKNPSKGLVTTPYVRNLTESVHRVFRSYGVQAHSKPSSSLRQLLARLKRPPPPLGIYVVPSTTSPAGKGRNGL